MFLVGLEEGCCSVFVELMSLYMVNVARKEGRRMGVLNK